MHGVYDKAVAKLGPTFWGCPPPVGFTNHKAQGKSYHEPLHRYSNESITRRGLLQLLLKSGKDLTPTRSRGG
jgi:hypothetical protein